MHPFNELLVQGTTNALKAFDRTYVSTINSLRKGGKAGEVRAMQMVNLQKAMFVIGMFSLLESTVQKDSKCKNGNNEIKDKLCVHGYEKVKEKYELYCAAINILKHGKGSSYDFLMKNYHKLPFKVKLPDEVFFYEGDVSEISTLIEVDNEFVINCAVLVDVIYKILTCIYDGSELYGLTEDEIRIVERKDVKIIK